MSQIHSFIHRRRPATEMEKRKMQYRVEEWKKKRAERMNEKKAERKEKLHFSSKTLVRKFKATGRAFEIDWRSYFFVLFYEEALKIIWCNFSKTIIATWGLMFDSHTHT